jgi:hypothetical protein
LWREGQSLSEANVQSEETRLRVYEWGKSLNSEDALALARRFLDIHKSAASCVKMIEELPLAGAAAEQARIVTRLEVELVHELADQIAKAAPLFERVSGQLHSPPGPRSPE